MLKISNKNKSLFIVMKNLLIMEKLLLIVVMKYLISVKI